MMSLWRTAWDVASTVVLVWLLAAGVEWLVEWRRGNRGVRDEHDRLKPAPALALVLGGMLAAACLATLVAP